MKANRWALSIVSALLAATPARSQMLGPSDAGGVGLSVSFGWNSAGGNSGSLNGVQAQIILEKDHIVVSKYGQTAEGDDVGAECRKHLARGSDGKVVMSGENLRRMQICDLRETRANANPVSHALFLPIVAGSRNCKDWQLSTGQFHLCATILQQSPNMLRMEYEEASNYDRDFRVSRVRFEIGLQRSDKIRLGHIWGCTLKVLDAFSFNPHEPGKLMPYQNVGHERCELDTTNQVTGERPPSESPEDQAILKAAERKTTACVPRAGGGYVASVYDRDMAGSGDAIIETASSDDKGQMQFMNSKVYPGEIAWTNVSTRLDRSKVEESFKAGTYAARATGLWGRTFENGAQAFFITCRF